jgi:hypothetical protein
MTEAKGIKQVIKDNYLQPAFLICAAVLMITAGSISAAVKFMGIYLSKEPIPLKKSLSELDKSILTPYKVAAKEKIENPDVIETLGTEDYIQWVLEDTSVPETSNVRFCSLFITYYPLPDLVPHRPEECYVGGGFRQISFESVKFEINTGLKSRQVNAISLVFADTKSTTLVGETTMPVFYVFSVNGEYVGGRGDARFKILMKNITGKFSYFSKVEWKFYNNKFGRTTFPNKQDAIEASKKLLAVILPVLEKEHWPNPRN